MRLSPEYDGDRKSDALAVRFRVVLRVLLNRSQLVGIFDKADSDAVLMSRAAGSILRMTGED